MSKRVLITGGCGFIGSNLIRFLRTHRPDWRLTNLDSLSYSGNPENLADLARDHNYEFVHADIRDADTADKLIPQHDAVMHLAAESHVDRSIMDASPFVSTNVHGTQVLLDAARRANANGWNGRFLNVSTDEVYGSLPLDRPDDRFTESSPIEPNSPYAASKAAADMLARAYHHTFGLDIITTRCSNNFGPYQFPEKVIPLFVTNLLEDRHVPLYGDGLNIRDWIHVDDHAEALLAVLERGKPGEVYNIGADNEHANIDLTRAILGIMGKGEDMIRPVKDRPGHDRRYAIDSAKIRSQIGWKPSRSAWPDALRKTIAWYTANRPWWERVKSGAYRDYYNRQYAESDA